MKVLHINSEKSWRGGEQQMSSLMNLLRDEGVENHVLCRKDSEAANRLREQGFIVHEVGFSGLKIKASLKLKSLSGQFDIIHTHTANAHTVAYYSAILGSQTPIVVSKRTDFPVKSPKKFNHQKIAKILCVSKKIQEITQKDVIKPDRVETVYSGIDTKRFEGDQKDIRDLIGVSKKEVLIGNCSALAPQKDYFTFIDLAKRFPDKHFVLIGDGPLEDQLKEYAAGAENIHFTGFLKDINLYLKSLDFFLMTSETEGLGTSLLDAMICKIPIVATRAGGIPEIVIHEQTGLTAEVRDIEELARQLNRMLEDSDLRQKLTQNAYNNVIKNFSREITAKKTYEVYKRILA